MGNRKLARGRLLPAVLGVFLFAIVFLSVFLSTLPKDALLSPLDSALAARGLGFRCERARFAFPLGIRCDNAALRTDSGKTFSLDAVSAAWEWSGLFRWLPVHIGASRGTSSLDVRTSPNLPDPGKVRLSLRRVGSGDLSEWIALSEGTGFLIDAAEMGWGKSSDGSISGSGEGALSWIRFPVPAKDSPVSEAELKDVRLKFAIRGGSLLISSLEGTYEGSSVDGTGEITRFLTPSVSTITFHLRIRNPLEGKVATIFNMVSKNARNATLRISGTLRSPAGEFQFF